MTLPNFKNYYKATEIKTTQYQKGHLIFFFKCKRNSMKDKLGVQYTAYLYAKMMNLDLYLTPYTKNNSKWKINVKYKSIKLLEENTGESLHGLVHHTKRTSCKK